MPTLAKEDGTAELHELAVQAWNEAGRDLAAWPPDEEQLVARLRDYYEDHPTGGHLHIATDDENLEDGHLVFCLSLARDAGDERAIWIALALLSMGEEERESVCVNRYREFAQ